MSVMHYICRLGGNTHGVVQQAVIAVALLNHDCSGIGIPGHTTRRRRTHATGGKVGFELATNGIQLYDVAN